MYNTPFFHTVLLFLAAISGQLSEQLQKDLGTNSVILDDQELYIKKEITGGGIVDLVDANTRKVTGICSFDENTLKTGRAFVFDKVSILYDTNAAAGLEGNLAYNTAAPKELTNADFVVSQDGREVFRMPVRSLHNIETGNAIDDEYIQLKTLRHLVDTREIKLQLHFPTGVSLQGANKHYIYVRIGGVQTTKKTNA
jgi:hypothetical protein